MHNPFYSVGILIIGAVDAIQRLLCHYVFLHTIEKDPNRVLAVHRRRLYDNFVYFYIILNLPLGALSSLLRTLKSLIVNFWLLPRLDMSILNREYAKYDPGYQAYMGFLAMESIYRNPSMRTFVDILNQSV